MKNISVAQAIVLVACIAAPLAAYKLFGNEGAYAATVAGMVLNFMLGRAPEPMPEAPPMSSSGVKLTGLPGGKQDNDGAA